MKITKLTLEHNTRFSLNNIRLLTYTPKNQIQLIAGVNGAGKSSLLNELTPFPADLKKDYMDGGYKVIEIEHNGDEYILTTRDKHSFIKNNEELNVVGNKRIQLSLIEEHFNITPANYKMVAGSKLFTDMGVTARKDWIFEITNLDIDYPLSVYAKLKVRQNELKGAISILTAKGSVKVDTGDLDALVTKSKELTTKLEELTSSLKPFSKNKYTLTELTDIINNKKIEVDRLTKLISDIDVVKRDSCIANISRLSHEIITVNKDIKDITRLEELKEQKKELDILKTKLLKLESNPLDIIKEATNILAIVSKIDLDIVDKFIGIDIEEVKSKYNTTTKAITELQSMIDSKHMEIGIITSITDSKTQLVCNNCNSSFKHDTLQTNVNALREEINALTAKLGTFKEVLTTLEDVYKDIPLFLSYKESLTYKTTIPELKIYLVDIFELTNVRSSLLMYVNKVRDHMESLTEIDKINSNIKFIESFNPETTLDTLYDKLTALSKDKGTYESTLKLIDNTILNNTKINHIKKEIDNFTKIREDVISNLEIDKYNSIINEKIKEHRLLLNKNNEEIINSNTYLRIKEEREKEIEEYKERLEVVKQSMAELSPTNGLIGKLLKKDIGEILNDVNTIIKIIWDYDIEVLPMSVDSEELTYKFPVTINGNDGADDVSLLSTSQKEVINLAFRMVTMRRLNLINYPFMLDEFARTFDNIHVNKAYDVVDTLKKMFSQVFIVSHFETTYTKLKGDADVSLLTKDYLTLLENNDRIELEYY